ncbi:hypothetical protein BY996DRAFT_8424017, partial [Phakopsora pachyrhizi]
KRVPLSSGGEEIGSHVIPKGAVASSAAHVRSSENARGNNNHSLSYKSIISHRTPSSSITPGRSSAANCPTSLNLAARLEEDLEPVQASKIIVRVRCYASIGNSASTSPRPESNSSITNPHHPPSSSSSSSSSHKSTVSILWQTEKIVWDAHHTSSAIPHIYENSDDKTFCQLIGNSIHPWRLTIPVLDVQPNKEGNALGSITYKNWRAWWSLEAVIYHQPMGNYGNKIMKSYQLHLPNYYNSHQ